MKFDSIYIERDIMDLKDVKIILKKHNSENIIECENYKEIFNLKNQNFRLQKNNLSLILAKKRNNLILKTPDQFNIGFKENYYFSHMLNCIYDCKYCFLQGMYNSANLVFFINYNDFAKKIKEICKSSNRSICFFSGYDCDSLALEKITNFSRYFINLFRNLKGHFLEIRTKSVNISFLKNIKVTKNVIIAFSLNPNDIISEFEIKTPSLKKRIKAISYLQGLGWNIGLRFDPVMYSNNFEECYKFFFKEIFSNINSKKIHSITIGSFRMPKKFFSKLSKIRPFDNFLYQNYKANRAVVGHEKKNEIQEFCLNEIKKYTDAENIFFN
ncbi:MAG: DNA photolyase [Rickettsiales bacterium]|nr:DNA photolyase [Rickettsiales bacterium]